MSYVIYHDIKGYQKGAPVAFWSTRHETKSINAQYADGVLITLGNPRKHVWTYVTGLSDDFNYPVLVLLHLDQIQPPLLAITTTANRVI